MDYHDIDLFKASQAQVMIARKVKIQKLLREPRSIVGLDVSYRGETGFAAAVLINYKTLEIEEVEVAEGRVVFPYIPGYLAFREAPLMLKALMRLKGEKDLLVVNGHGIAHPRRCGIASYLGVIMGLPSIGVAKRLLAGSVVERNGKRLIVIDGIVAGVVLRLGKSDLYITIGHMVDIEDLEEIARRTTISGRSLPEPIYWADRISREKSLGRISSQRTLI